MALKSMFKRHKSSLKRLINKPAYAIVFALPFIYFSGETKASRNTFNENLFVNRNIERERSVFHDAKNNNELDNFLIAEDSSLDLSNTVEEEKKNLKRIDEGIEQKVEQIKTEEEEKRVLISEIIIEGLEDHPDKERLEVIAYDAMLIRPGSKVTSEELSLIHI